MKKLCAFNAHPEIELGCLCIQSLLAWLTLKKMMRSQLNTKYNAPKRLGIYGDRHIIYLTSTLTFRL